jgi:[acyl-carrier-protein] S-malonyltransferase
MSNSEQLGTSFAYVFPGQGSQVVGMGKDLYEGSPAAKAAIEEADDILGARLSTLMFEGPVEELTPMAAAGHSLGEFTALVAAGSLSFPDTLRLVRERGRVMAEAGTARPGGMAAVLGLDEEALTAVCEEASANGVINVANANCPGQIVISGEVPALEVAMEMAKAAGAKRVARLPVSIASHSPLMAEVSAQLKEITAGLPFVAPAFPIVGNVSAAPVQTVNDIHAELEHHVERPVNWTGSVQTMVGLGADTFVELGAGTVLAGLIKRIDRNVRTIGTADLGL